MTPYLLPGERAKVETRPYKSGLLLGKVRQILEPSAKRVKPPCPYFGRCGGCQYQHAPYDYELEQKRDILAEVLRRVGKIELSPPPVVAGEPLEYRNRAQVHFSGGQLGFLEAGSHVLCPIDRCPISSPRLNEAIGALLGMTRERKRFPRFLKTVELFTNETDVQLNVLEKDQGLARSFFEWAEAEIPGFANGPIEYPAGEFRYRVGHRSFFQVNRFLVERLVSLALPEQGGAKALDLYAGVGLFSLPLARRFERVISVESSQSAVRDLEFNAERAGVAPVVWRGAVEEYLTSVERPVDFVLADPPRAGLGKAAVESLLRLGAPRMTLVSCDPSTLARDLAALLAGGYRIDGITLVDLFPQTFHIETVTRLSR
ncbi:MAG TPA: class I SAM-dependent RNA methyltransferase [Solibacterales bacterium]|nr:class I SAM-dependent RNA methyltransferase [Bryobacterales bacterium]